MSSNVKVNTYTHSVAYVTDQMLTSLKQIIIQIGLNPEKFVNDWASTERAVKAWLESQDLTSMTLEVYKPHSNQLVTRWDFDIDYTYGTGDEGDFWADSDAIKFAIKKAGVVAASCSYRIMLGTKNGRPDVTGWGPGEYLSTDGFTRRPIGTTIGANYIGTNTCYWTS